MSDRRPCSCGYVTVNPDADSSAVCGGCGRPLGEAKPLGGDTQAFAAARPPAEGEPVEHVVKIKRKPAPTPPPDVPGYEILGELGRGGMGVVYKAREKVLNRVVALKMILAGAHASEAERARFRKEAEAVAALHHAGIVQIFHVGEHAGQPYLVLEYVDGGNLADKIGGGNLMPVREAAAVVEQLAAAMQYAHEQGVIHRDLKPANILLSKADGGRKGDSSGSGSGGSSLTGPRSSPPSTLFKISDFGLAKKLDDTVAAGGGTRTGAVMGTPSYISPEQAAGKAAHVTARSDVYSLGAILYEMLTDRPPFKADTPLETVLQVINDEPVSPSKLRPKLPRDLETICLKCLEKDPLKRYASAGELAADLDRFLRGEPILARPLSPLARGWKWVRRHPAISVFGLTAAAAIVAVVAVLVTSNAGLTEANRLKEREAKAAREQEAIAKEQKEKADQLAGERQQALDDLAAQAEKNRRSLYALQLMQVAGTVARNPVAALLLLDDPVKCPPDLRDFVWRYLRRLCTRSEQVLTAHHRPVRAVAVSPDGLLVATADDVGTVLLWHPQTKAVYARLVGHTRAVNGVAFAPDGTALATTGADGTVRVWRLEPDFLETVRLSSRLLPDTQAELNRLLPGAGPGLAVPIKPSAVIPAFGRGGRCVAFSPDGKLLAAGGSDSGQSDGVARVWELAALLPTVDPPRAAVLGPAAPVGEWAAAHTTDRPKPVKEVMKDHFKPIYCLAFSPNGQTLATGSEDRGVTLTSLTSDKREQLRQHGGPVYALAYSPDGSTLATADNDETPVIVLWDVSKRRVTEKGKLVGHTGPIHGLAFSPDSRTLASSGGVAPGNNSDPTVRVWDVDTAAELVRLYGHRGTVHDVGWLPDRRTLVSASDDATARVWQTALRPCEAVPLFGDETAKVQAAAVTASGNTVVTADPRGVHLWAVDKLFSGRQAVAELPVFLSTGRAADAREFPVTALAVSPDGTLVAVATAEGVRVWDLNAGVRVFGSAVLTVTPRLLADAGEVRAVQFTPDGGKLIALTARGLRAWQPCSGADVTPECWRTADVDSQESALAVSPDGGTVIASGRQNNTPGVVVADAACTHFHPMRADVTALDFAPDGTRLVAALKGVPGEVWAVEKGGGLPTEKVCELSHPLAGLRFCREGKTLYGVRANRELVLLDAATGVDRGVLEGHADRIVGAGLTPKDMQLVTIGRDGTVKRWNADPPPRGFFRGDGLPQQGTPSPPAPAPRPVR